MSVELKLNAVLPQQVEPIEVDNACIVTIGGQALLLVEIDIEVPVNPIESVIAFCLTAAQAQALRNDGIEDCMIVNDIPATIPGRTVELRGVLCFGDQAFVILEVETSGQTPTEELVLVRTSRVPTICDTVPIVS